MGRWDRGRGRGRGGGGGRYDNRRRTLKRDFREPRRTGHHKKRDWDEIVKENEKFEEYYKAQGVVPDDQWDEFMETLRRPLPVTFRINGRGRFAEALKSTIDSMCEKPEVQSEKNIVPKALSWYPGGLAYSVLASKNDLRRVSSLAEFHELLKRETDGGSMSRQEAVSMIPPLFLDVKPEHHVLDMCASPGSKTFQILEMLHMDPQVPPTGLVIANDLDYQRCNLLTHQIKRMCSPNIMITSHDATQFPTRKRYVDENVLSFDRILCDVPCSGDGTLRKSPDIWSQWRPGNGNAMHIQQLRITMKGCQALKVGGRLVYSTCSMNPIEDEAVVAEVIRRTQGAMELVDVSEQVPELKRMPGMKRWKVCDNNRSFENYEEAKRVRKEGGFRLIVDETFFPDEASDEMPLERCMRVLPHQQDTGGFFIAVLEKVRELPRMQFPSADHRWEDCDHRPEKFRNRQRRGGARNDAPGEGAKNDAPGESVKDDAPGESVKDDAPGEGVEMDAPGEGVEMDAPEKGKKDAPGEGAKKDALEEGAKKDAPEEGVKIDAPEKAPIGLLLEPTAEKEAPKEAQKEEAVEEEEPRTEEKKLTFFNGGDYPQIHKGIDPIILLDEHPLVQNVSEFYGMEGFDLGKHLISRMVKDGQVRRVYYTCEAVKDLMRRDADHFLRIQAVGQKLLERHEHKNKALPCAYRFSQEGLPSVLKHVTKRRLYVTLDDAIRFLIDRALPLRQEEDYDEVITERSTADGEPPKDTDLKKDDSVADGEPPPSTGTAMEVDEKTEEGNGEPKTQEKHKKDERPPRPPPVFVSDPSLLEQLKDFGDGGAIVMLRDSDAQALELPLSTEAQGGLAANAPVAVSCWRTRYRINIMMSKPEALLLAGKLQEKARAKDMLGTRSGVVEGGVEADGSRKRGHEDVSKTQETQEREEKSRKIAGSADIRV